MPYYYYTTTGMQTCGYIAVIVISLVYTHRKQITKSVYHTNENSTYSEQRPLI